MSNVSPEATEGAFDALAEIVKTNGFFLWGARGLKDITGAKRLGARKAERIDAELARRGVHHIPGRIPRDENAKVLLYAPNGNDGLGTLVHHLVGSNGINLSSEALNLVGAILDKHAEAVRAVEAAES
ncbi:hypothetical protein OG596_17510 [Streptomyces sp. NBC_01102]|uniref:hypothetical protein n=1 Tax=Streptomyces TaxID=1883 RepID=UPI003327AE51|nr:hypothetical protein OG596_17510 [Streptomyces sp. NBC_01102]